MDAKTWAEFVKNCAEALAIIVGGGGYFLYRSLRGAFTSNLSLSLSCARTKIPDTTEDWVAVKAKLSKGDRYSIELHDAQIRVSGPGVTTVCERFVGIDRRSYDTEPIKDDKGNAIGKTRKAIAFDRIAKSVPLLVLTPGEQTQFAHYVKVPSNSICTLEVVVVAKRWYHRWLRWEPNADKLGQWRASAVSMPKS
jgi:hypothetical protein